MLCKSNWSNQRCWQQVIIKNKHNNQCRKKLLKKANVVCLSYHFTNPIRTEKSRSKDIYEKTIYIKRNRYKFTATWRLYLYVVTNFCNIWIICWSYSIVFFVILSKCIFLLSFRNTANHQNVLFLGFSFISLPNHSNEIQYQIRTTTYGLPFGFRSLQKQHNLILNGIFIN